MKLITRITISHFLLTAIIFGIGAVGAYFFIRSEVNEKVDWKLLGERRRIRQNATSLADLANPDLNINSHLEVVPFTDSLEFRYEFKDTVLINPRRRREEPFRQLNFVHPLDSTYYLISLRKNMVESRDLTAGLWRAMGVVAVGLLLVLILSNYFLSKNIWSTLYQTVNTIKNYQLSRNESLQLAPTSIEELNELHRAFNKMAARIESDYRSVKEFSENASHEMQTPLSVIRSKIELLLQQPQLEPELLNHLQAIDRAAGKLSRLNQALLLLAKIENRQFEANEPVDLQEIVENHLNELAEFIQFKQLTIHKKIENPPTIRMHPVLAEVLIKNLLVNALKYSAPPGIIQIDLNPSALTIANSGSPLKISTAQLFQRFKKGNQTADSLGLGLSIVKKICDFYNFDIRYSYQNQLHTFKITFDRINEIH